MPPCWREPFPRGPPASPSASTSEELTTREPCRNTSAAPLGPTVAYPVPSPDLSAPGFLFFFPPSPLGIFCFIIFLIIFKSYGF